MAGSFGGTVKLSGESEYRKALKDITSNLKLVSSELKLTNTQFANGDSTLKQAKSSYNSMKITLEEQKAKVSDLRKALKEAEVEYGSNNDKVKQFKTQLNNAETQLKQMEDATNKNNKELKDMKNGFEDAGNGALKFGDLVKANVIGDIIVGGFKNLVNLAKQVGTTLLNVGKQALESYADYEQLIGGVETLFKENANIVEKYANNAYKTAGLSANEYMETVTSFSASLLQSLNGDTAKSAQVADKAITDMSDNANKMGTSMESIQNAYQGFAKQNYTMLDNLKLGYGGTKSEMERLISDANKLAEAQGQAGNLTIESYADVVEAIHLVQENMGITGTTAKEASTTIQGSIASMKSAWQNMLTGIADEEAPFDNLINNLVDSIITAGENLLPRIKVIAEGISTLVLSGIQLIVNHLPEIIKVGADILKSLVQGIQETLPEIINATIQIVEVLLNGLIESLPNILDAGVQAIIQLAQGLAQALPELIPQAVDAVITIVEGLLDNIDQIIDAGIQLIMGLADGLIEAIPRLIEKIPIIIEKLINAITTNLPKLIEAGITLIIKLAEGLIKAIPQLISKIPQIISSIVSGFAKGFSSIVEIGKNIVDGIWQGIKNAKDWIWNKIKEWCGNIFNGIKSFFGIHSPSTLFRDEVGKNLALGVGEGFSDTMKEVSEDMNNAIPNEFDINSSMNIPNNNSTYQLKDALVEAFKEFKPKIILNSKEVGEFAFEYGNIRFGSYYD